jgi:putative membrane protein
VPVSSSLIALFLPWELSPVVLATIALVLATYNVGAARMAPGVSGSRRVAFHLGLLLIYGALQTSWDYYASHMFFVHRLQHFVLHDIGPALLAASAPTAVLSKGLPAWLGERLAWANRRLGPAARLVFDPWTATAMYVASLLVWIWPPIHFQVMLSGWLYRLMNWSVVLGDLPFWWLILDPRPYPFARIKSGYRILMLTIVMLPMMLSGAILSLSRHDLYPVYDICGRFAPVSALTDQRLGGLIIWIPGSVLILIVLLIILGRTLHEDEASGLSALKDFGPAVRRA